MFLPFLVPLIIVVAKNTSQPNYAMAPQRYQRSLAFDNANGDSPGQPNTILVPYEFSLDFPIEDQKEFDETAKYVSSKTCMRFVPRAWQKKYLYIAPNYAEHNFEGSWQRFNYSLPEGPGLQQEGLTEAEFDDIVYHINRYYCKASY